MKKILGILATGSILGTSASNFKNFNETNVITQNVESNIDYLQGTDKDFTAYLSNKSMSILENDYLLHKTPEQAADDLITKQHFNLNQVSKDAVIQTFTIALKNPSVLANVAKQEGKVGVSVEVTNYNVQPTSAKPIN